MQGCWEIQSFRGNYDPGERGDVNLGDWSLLSAVLTLNKLVPGLLNPCLQGWTGPALSQPYPSRPLCALGGGDSLGVPVSLRFLGETDMGGGQYLLLLLYQSVCLSVCLYHLSVSCLFSSVLPWVSVCWGERFTLRNSSWGTVEPKTAGRVARLLGRLASCPFPGGELFQKHGFVCEAWGLGEAPPVPFPGPTTVLRVG